MRFTLWQTSNILEAVGRNAQRKDMKRPRVARVSHIDLGV